ncbi:MAG: ABC-type multidrug transport system ATPase and permease component [Acidimicrobiaceae bacterium]|nr:ABC-type multidrug transport system ATPase and permease component [Acidimicrobiaceae bacterium]
MRVTRRTTAAPPSDEAAASGESAEAGGDRVPGRHLLRATLQMIAPYRRRAILGLVVLVASIATTLAGPALVEYAINDGLVHHHSMRVVDIAGASYLVAAIASYFLTAAQTRLISSTGEFVLSDLRKRVFVHLLAQPLAFFDGERSGQLLSRMTADIDVLETLVQNGLGTFATSVGLFVFSIIVLLVTSPLLFLATVVCLGPVLVAAMHYRRTSTRAYTAVRERIGETLSSLDEGLAGVRVVQAFRQERRVASEFDRRNASQLESEMRTVRLASRFFPKVEGSGVLASVAVLLVGGVLVVHHLTSVGAVAAFVLYIANLFSSIQSLSQLFDLLQSSGAALGTVVSLLETEPSMVDPSDPVPLPRRGKLELRQVSFAYGRHGHGYEDGEADCEAMPSPEDAPEARSVLSGVDLDVEEGEHLVLVGSTGAGKSTLAKLMGRLYDPSGGTVCFGGVDLREASLAHLRERIVVVPQECFLFRGTVLDNILVGRPGAKEHEARAAVLQLGLDERLDELPQGLETDVGERGSHLSAGERQLVSLARAVLTDPAVLVMDEATSSIDPGTEVAVERALAVLAKGRTTITVAHRLTTAERADRVAVVEDGELVEVGPHGELVEAEGHYARLFSAWLGDGASLSEESASS